jgi:hypothetical protein
MNNPFNNAVELAIAYSSLEFGGSAVQGRVNVPQWQLLFRARLGIVQTRCRMGSLSLDMQKYFILQSTYFILQSTHDRS